MTNPSIRFIIIRMLYIVYGTMTDIGTSTKRHFQENGFVWIQKDTYIVEKNGTLLGRDKRLVTEEEIERCQYSYHVLNRKVGFNESDIVDAVFGKEKRLLTVSTDDITLLKNLKRAFGDYVVLIYAFITEPQIKAALLRGYPNIPNSELEKRIELGKCIKMTYLKNAELFDETVVFSDEFKFDELYTQYDRIIARYSEAEKRLNNSKYVELPYAGKRPYVFISYSHEDKINVFPLLKMLQTNKCRIWYDEGIKIGENWRKTVRTKIKNSKLMLLFSSDNSRESPYVMFEYTEAQSFNINTIVVHLDDKGFPKGYEGLQYLDARDDGFDRKLLSGISRTASSVFTVKPKKQA